MRIMFFVNSIRRKKKYPQEIGKMDNRAVVFAHFDKHNIVDDYVIFYLSELKKNSRTIIFVSTSSLSEEEKARLDGICSIVITRPNIGYDFFSWKTGLAQLRNLENYNELVICNDSCYGPVFDLHPIFQKMRFSKADFWGITSNSQIRFHLQSYFLVFRKQVFLSKEFQDFWRDMKIIDSKTEIVNTYEIGLTQKLINANFKADALFKLTLLNAHIILFATFRNLLGYVYNCFIYLFFTNTRRYQLLISNGFHISRINHLLHTNPTHRLCLTTLKHGCPFVKIELLRDNPLNINISDIFHYLLKNSAFKMIYIQNHLDRIRNHPK